MSRLGLALGLATLGCVPAVAAPPKAPAAPAAKPAPPPAKKPMPSPRVVKIEETTVATIDGWRVTCGNIMKGKWTLPDGSSREGPSAEVGLYDDQRAERGERTVGEGAVLEIAGGRWAVAKVAPGGKGDNGHVELVEQP